MSLFAEAQRLPAGYGYGWDERVVELPWIVSQGLGGRLLDAGSTLNHPHIVEPCLEMVESMTITTPRRSRRCSRTRGSHTSTATCASCRSATTGSTPWSAPRPSSTSAWTARIYGHDAPRAHDPAPSSAARSRSSTRVLRPGGRLLLTVPFGRAEDHGWLVQFDANRLDDLIGGVAAADRETTIYSYGEEGWQLSSRGRGRGRELSRRPRGSRAARGPRDGRARGGVRQPALRSRAATRRRGASSMRAQAVR